MNNCDTYFMIMRIFPVLLMAITGCVIRHTQKINQHYSYTHYYLAACQLLGVVYYVCYVLASFSSSLSLYEYTYIHIRGPEGSTNNAQSILGILLEGHYFFHSRSLGLLQNLQKTHNLIFKVKFLCQKSIKVL